MKKLTLLLLGAGLLFAQNPKSDHHLFFHVTLSPQVGAEQSGRLLIFLHPGLGKDHLDVGFSPGETWIAAREIDALQPGLRSRSMATRLLSRKASRRLRQATTR